MSMCSSQTWLGAGGPNGKMTDLNGADGKPAFPLADRGEEAATPCVGHKIRTPRRQERGRNCTEREPPKRWRAWGGQGRRTSDQTDLEKKTTVWAKLQIEII